METLEKWTQRVWSVIIVLAVAYFVSQYAEAKPTVVVEDLQVTIPVKIMKPKNEIWVMSIDTGIASHPRLDKFVQRKAGYNYEDPHGHGTHVAGIIIYGPKQSIDAFRDVVCHNVKLFSCRYEVDERFRLFKSDKSIQQTLDCVKQATEMGIDYINYSGGGPGWSFSEYLIFKAFTDSGGVVVAAAGNESKTLDDDYQYFPASYRYGMLYRDPSFVKRRAKPLTNIKVVQAMCGDEPCEFSNTAPDAEKEPGKNILSTSNKNESFFFMNGTSQAAPAYLHKLLKKDCERLNSNSPKL